MNDTSYEEEEQHEDDVVASPFAKRQGHYMRWENLNMTVLLANKKLPPKQILNHVSGVAPSGQLTAIMGTSGSGKTSLLNVLSGRVDTRHGVTVEGQVLLDEQPVDPSQVTVRQRIAFVAQDDSLPVTATPREAILFSARLRLPRTVTDEHLIQLTNNMLQELHLTEAADTVVGGTLVKGLSGGERKRTSVGVELVTQPSIVFLDEATSGLDSFNALELCQVLKQVAAAGSAVLLTIHQPSSDIFTTLDRLVLLKAGSVMYSGRADQVVEYFGARGYPCPSHYNPADWILNISQSFKMDQLKDDGFFGDFDTEETEQQAQDGNNNVGKSIGLVKRKDRVGFFVQTKLLFQREVQNLVRNKKALAARTGMTLMVSLLAGIIFFQVAQRDLNDFINVQSTFGALLVSLIANVFSTALPSLVAFPEERPVFIREYSTNHYTVTSYFASRFTMEMLVTACQVMVSSLITYFMVGYTGQFGPFWGCLYLLAMTSTALGVMLGCSVKDPGLAVEFLPLIFMPQILFAGFFVPPDLIPVWLRWIAYIFPLTYATRIVLVNEFDGKCDSTVAECLATPKPAEACPNYCNLVLDNANANPNDVWWYWLVLLGQFCFFRGLALFILRRKASSFY